MHYVPGLTPEIFFTLFKLSQAVVWFYMRGGSPFGLPYFDGTRINKKGVIDITPATKLSAYGQIFKVVIIIR